MKADYTGKIHHVSRDFWTKKVVVSFLIDQEITEVEQTDKPLSIVVKTLSRPRSLDSNKYFHVLCQKIADKVGVPMALIKNHLIIDYGQIWYLDDGEMWEYVSNATPDYIEKREEIHMKLIGMTDDLRYRYRVYRGSHTYTAAEMNLLIEGTVREAKDLGIETATPEELMKMSLLWEARRKGSNDYSRKD